MPKYICLWLSFLIYHHLRQIGYDHTIFPYLLRMETNWVWSLPISYTYRRTITLISSINFSFTVVDQDLAKILPKLGCQIWRFAGESINIVVLSSQAQVHPYLGYSWMIAYNMYDQGKTCYSPSTVEILHQFEESWMLRTHFIVPVYHLFFLGVRNIEFLRSTECQPQERSYYSITYEDKIMTRVLLCFHNPLYIQDFLTHHFL